MENKKCINCSKDFLPRQVRSKYCSYKCKQAYKYANFKQEIYTNTCFGCTQKFNSYRNNLQYCSKSCAGKGGKNNLTIEEIINFVKENPQIRISRLRKKLNTSTRTIYNILNKNGYNSYGKFVETVKGVYLINLKSYTSNAAIRCFEYIKTLVNYPYQTEVIFDGLINPETKRSLRVDCLFNEINLVVEYNGIQHYKNTPYFHKGKNTLESQKMKDNIRLEFFKNSKYKYIVIPYWFTTEDIHSEITSSQAIDHSIEGSEITGEKMGSLNNQTQRPTP